MKKNLKVNHIKEKNSYHLETNRTNLSSSIETPIQRGPPATPTGTAESTLPSDETPLLPESITTPMLNNLQSLQMRMLY